LQRKSIEKRSEFFGLSKELFKKDNFLFQLTDSQLTNSDGSDSEDQIFAFDKAKNTVTLVASKSQVNF